MPRASITDLETIKRNLGSFLREFNGNDEDHLATGLLDRLLRGPSPEVRLFTADEVAVLVQAIASAERNATGATIMAHVKADRDITPKSAEAIRKIVVAAYVEMLVGE